MVDISKEKTFEVQGHRVKSRDTVLQYKEPSRDTWFDYISIVDESDAKYAREQMLSKGPISWRIRWTAEAKRCCENDPDAFEGGD